MHDSCFMRMMTLGLSMTAVVASAAGSITVNETNGTSFASGTFVTRFVLGESGLGGNNPYSYGYPLSYSLGDRQEAEGGVFTRKTWDAPVYGTMGSVIARKLLVFGSDSDVRHVRDWLLTAPVDATGWVDGSAGDRWHLASNKGTLESNAEYVLMARLYVAHTGDTALFDAPISRLVCLNSGAGGAWQSPVHVNAAQASCTGTPSASTVFLERIRQYRPGPSTNPLLSSPGRALGQLFTAPAAFSALRVALSPSGQGRPFRLLLVNGAGTTVYDTTFTQLPGGQPWFEVQTGVLPAGHYNLELHPVGNDLDGSTWWHSVQWASEVGSHVKGGAMGKSFETNPFNPATYWNVRAKLEQALSWSLARSTHNGQRGIFVIPYAWLRGTGQPEATAATYFDLFKSGYKDSYVAARYLEAMAAYEELQQAGLVSVQLGGTDVAQMRANYAAQFVGSSGSVTSWVGCSAWSGVTSPLCNPLAVDDLSKQHPYDVGWVPATAIAARLFPSNTAVQQTWSSMRDVSRVAAGHFRTNVIPVESVSPDIWAANADWTSKTTNPAGFAAKVPSVGGDWHLFADGVGRGNFGRQENNGGVLLVNAAFVYDVGSYPDIYADWKGFVSAVNQMTGQLAAGVWRPAAFQQYIRSPVIDPLVLQVCANGSQFPVDGDGKTLCHYYKSVSYHLPEAGAMAPAFVSGLLKLNVSVGGALTVYGSPFVTGLVSSGGGYVTQFIPMTSAQIAAWPSEVTSVAVDDFRVRGALLDFTCSRTSGGLNCTQR
jgi:hypothetical protein